MKIAKFFQYIYLFFAALFLYDAVSNWNAEGNRAYVSLAFTALAIFMFFFRRKFNNKYKDNNNAK
ncbi:hypothetical protein KO494_06475 [Lacinutrix sp. C3R15]|uniref:hypothetical protein n=1 Tax=Flavobacteriaceae TaxID=49546 RepID=UPI001C091DDD|nr:MULTISPECIES: hypothetical protein [Flavobacteriaceae]MBU2939179.1 hypothetical protein [Lacinutrix sp. C3R15]MDO6622495.1 hypothetical protein [Oceanihabitans sp. 1_MG-2023]